MTPRRPRDARPDRSERRPDARSTSSSGASRRAHRRRTVRRRHHDRRPPQPGRAARWWRDRLPATAARARPAVRVRGRPRRLHRLQGVRHRLPQPQRARRGRELAHGRRPARHRGPPGRRRHADRDQRLPPLRRPGLPQRLPGQRLREGPDHRHRRATSTTSCIGCSYCTLTCPYEVPRLQPDARHRPQVRHVQRPPGRGRGAGVRAGLPDRGDHASTWSTSPTSSPRSAPTATLALVPGAPASALTGAHHPLPVVADRSPADSVADRPRLGRTRPTRTRRSPSCWCSPRWRSARSLVDRAGCAGRAGAGSSGSRRCRPSWPCSPGCSPSAPRSSTSVARCSRGGRCSACGTRG